MKKERVIIMPCLDMQNGRVVKGVHFVDIADAGDPVECARAYCQAGADEIALLDITATVEGRATLIDVVRKVAAAVTIPFTVGGGIKDVESARAVLEAGADKVSVSSAAFRNPDLIPQLIEAFGAERVTVAIDVDVNEALPSGYEVYIDGGRTATGVDAVEWAQKVDSYGVPVILPTSKAGDGARTGYDLPVIRKMAEVCNAQIVASGGAGKCEDFLDAANAGATVLLAASVFHFHTIDIGELKKYLAENGVAVRRKDPLPQAKLYLFDMDHTLINTDCDVTWKYYAVRHGLAPEDAIETADDFIRRYDRGELHPEEFLKFQLAEFIGKTPEEMAVHCQGNFDEFIRPVCYQSAKKLVAQLKAAGLPVAILTATNTTLAAPVAQYFGIDRLEGTTLALEDGKFNGALQGKYAIAAAKVAEAERIAADYGVTLAETAYFGDSINDRFVLDAVGFPVAANPCDALRKMAEEKNWTILDF